MPDPQGPRQSGPNVSKRKQAQFHLERAHSQLSSERDAIERKSKMLTAASAFKLPSAMTSAKSPAGPAPSPREHKRESSKLGMALQTGDFAGAKNHRRTVSSASTLAAQYSAASSSNSRAAVTSPQPPANAGLSSKTFGAAAAAAFKSSASPAAAATTAATTPSHSGVPASSPISISSIAAAKMSVANAKSHESQSIPRSASTRAGLAAAQHAEEEEFAAADTADRPDDQSVHRNFAEAAASQAAAVNDVAQHHRPSLPSSLGAAFSYERPPSAIDEFAGFDSAYDTRSRMSSQASLARLQPSASPRSVSSGSIKATMSHPGISTGARYMTPSPKPPSIASSPRDGIEIPISAQAAARVQPSPAFAPSRKSPAPTSVRPPSRPVDIGVPTSATTPPITTSRMTPSSVSTTGTNGMGTAGLAVNTSSTPAESSLPKSPRSPKPQVFAPVPRRSQNFAFVTPHHNASSSSLLAVPGNHNRALSPASSYVSTIERPPSSAKSPASALANKRPSLDLPQKPLRTSLYALSSGGSGESVDSLPANVQNLEAPLLAASKASTWAARDDAMSTASLQEKSERAKMLGHKKRNSAFGLGKLLKHSSKSSKKRSPFEPSDTGPALRISMREEKKGGFNEDKPWKHHSDSEKVSDAERKRYEGLYATNKGIHVNYLYDEDEAIGGDQGGTGASASETEGDHKAAVADAAWLEEEFRRVHGIVVRDLWKRSRLPDSTLAKIWDLVNRQHDVSLDREEFLVGMWLVDQCLYGKKLPSVIEDAVWSSVGRLNVKVRVKRKHKGRRHKKDK